MGKNKKILILTGHYLPGHRDGGPLRTIINITDALGDEYEFFIACLDRDHGDTDAYPNISRNKWNKAGKAKVWYVSPGGFSFGVLLKLVSQMDLVYLCSFYDDYGYKTLLLKKQRKITCPVVVASMGVFSKGALSHKSLKKKLFINGCKMIGLFKNVTWSVTSELEAKDVKREIGKSIKYVIAEDLPRTTIPGYQERKEPFSVVFLSRICPHKNLLAAVKILKSVKSDVQFYIYGPIQDEEYWEQCKKEMKSFPSNITWEYCGDVPSEDVQSKFAQHDVFLFPTKGENYGHVIFEALSVGCIPIISDQTPWVEIKENNAGFICSLDNLDNFANAIEKIARLDFVNRRKIAENSVCVAMEKVNKSKKETGYRKIFG